MFFFIVLLRDCFFFCLPNEPNDILNYLKETTSKVTRKINQPNADIRMIPEAGVQN